MPWLYALESRKYHRPLMKEGFQMGTTSYSSDASQMNPWQNLSMMISSWSAVCISFSFGGRSHITEKCNWTCFYFSFFLWIRSNASIRSITSQRTGQSFWHWAMSFLSSLNSFLLSCNAYLYLDMTSRLHGFLCHKPCCVLCFRQLRVFMTWNTVFVVSRKAYLGWVNNIKLTIP